jgi:acyl carrier protein
MTIIDDVKEVVVEQLSISADDLKDDAKFVEDLGADSLDVLVLVMGLVVDIEEKFDIEIPDEEAEKIQTVKDIVTFIEEHSK